MGSPDVKYGDSVVVIQHAATGYWLSYHTYETKKRGKKLTHSHMKLGLLWGEHAEMMSVCNSNHICIHICSLTFYIFTEDMNRNKYFKEIRLFKNFYSTILKCL